MKVVRGQGGHGGVVQHACGVDDSGQRVLAGDGGEQRGHRVAISGVAGGDGDRDAQRGELGREFRGAVGGVPPPAGQQQVTHPVVGDQPTGGELPQHAGPAGDQHCAVGVERDGKGERQFAGVPCLAEVAQGLWRVADVPCGHRQRT